MDFNDDTGTLSNVAIISPSSTTLTFTNTGAIKLPAGTTVQRPSNLAGELRYNNDFGLLEFNNGTIWANLQASVSSGSVTSVGLVAPAEFTVTSSPITSSGNLTLTKSNQLNNTIYAGPTVGNAQPTFRTISLAQKDLSDVTVATPVAGQILQYNGAAWINSTSSATSATGVLSSWTLVSGSRYYADFAHNLGTNNVVVQLYDNNTNAILQADSIVLTNVNTVRVTIIGNTRSIRIVVIANGMYAGIMNGGGTPAIIEDLYANRPSTGIVGRLFIAYDTKVFYRDNGTSWDIISASSGAIKSYSFFANSVDSPNTADFAVNALAPVITDATNTSLNVRSFSNTVEQGVSLLLPIPTGANNITFSIRGRSATAPTTASTVTHKLYSRLIPNNTAIGTWSAATSFTALTVPTNAFYQLYSQSYALSTLGMTVGNTYQLELTRAIGGVAFAWLVAEITISFT